jgi:hypothetical protein
MSENYDDDHHHHLHIGITAQNDFHLALKTIINTKEETEVEVDVELPD